MNQDKKSLQQELESLQAENQVLGEQVKQLLKTEKRLYTSQNALDFQLQRIQAMNEFSLESNVNHDSTPILVSALKLVHSLFLFDSSIALIEKKGELIPVAMRGDEDEETIVLKPLPESEAPLSYPKNLTTCKFINQDEIETLGFDFLNKIDDVCQRIYGRFLYQRLKNSKILLIPLKKRGEGHSGYVIACISTQKRLPHRQVFPTQQDLPLFSVTGAHIQAALENALLSQSKSFFLANMSHELRTPMHGILSFARFGQQKIQTATKEKLKSYFDEIHDSGTRLLTLLNDLLDLSKLESGTVNYSINILDLVATCEIVISELQAFAEEKKLKVEIISGEKPVMASFDQEKIIQVLRNLLSNAIKFSSENSLIQTKIQKQDNSVRVTVINHGIGIPKNELESIFDKFIQSSKTKTGAGGTGLGLAISREIIRQHDGRIWAECENNNETHFIFEIPLAAKSTQTAQEIA